MRKNDLRIVMVCVAFFIIIVIHKFWIYVFLSSSSISKLCQENSIRSNQAKTIRCLSSYTPYNVCTISSPTVLDPKVATFYAVGPTNWEDVTTAQTDNFTLTSGQPGPPCMVQHNAPALLFSTNGRICTGNFFHAFNDALIPLFVTVHSIFPDDQDRVLLISGSCDWWARKYTDLLQSFSKHPIITLGNDTSTHCFPSATVGLVSHGFMAIQSNLMADPKTLMHFHALLEKTYGQKKLPRNSDFALLVSAKRQPRLVLASRSGGIGRVISNQPELRQVAEEEGFEVIELEPKFETSLNETYKLVRQSHVLVGVHGAALTHLLFLRPGSVVIQVVPIGLQWTSEVCFGKPAKEMGLEYMEYEIGVEESSLVEKYGRDNLIVKDPRALQKRQWSTEIMNIYLKEQDVKLDMVRFREYLKKAYEKAKKLMEKEG